MKKLTYPLLAFICLFIAGCAVKPLTTSQYTLTGFSKKALTKGHSPHSIFVSSPDAVAGYQTEEMLYTNKPYELSPFVHNAWVNPPATMLLPLIVQSLNHSGYFYSIASSPDSATTDYRLDTQLIELQQNFLTKPSRVSLTIKFALIKVSDNKIIASRLIHHYETCPAETPYGGVVAANRGLEKVMAQMTDFVIRHIKKDSH